jgi:hypothetical protein
MSDQRCRLSNYDYSIVRPYMVTLKMHPKAAPLSVLDPASRLGLRHTPLTKPFVSIITTRLARYFKQTISVTRFVLMPNHIHLIIYLNPTDQTPKPNLIVVVEKLICFLTQAYHRIMGETDFAPIDPSWDDSISFTPQAYQRMRAYIDENPRRALLRRASQFCKCRTYRAKDGQRWWYYGDLNLVKRPTILPVECSRKIRPLSPLWEQWRTCAQKIRAGCAGVGTFMSPCEKQVMETILEAGGALIILLPQGISPYWHPGAEMESLCAQGRVLYLTPFAFEAAQPSTATLYQRCHQGGGLKEMMVRLAHNITAPPRA